MSGNFTFVGRFYFHFRFYYFLCSGDGVGFRGVSCTTAMSRPDGSFVRGFHLLGFLSSVSLLLFVSYRSQQEGEVF